MNNVTYATTGDVDTYASDHGHTYWTALTAAEKSRAVMTATLDIEAEHKQPRRSNIPWQYGCETLREAGALQALFVGRTIPQRDASDALSSLGAQGVSDGVVSANVPVGVKLDAQAKNLVKMKLKAARVLLNQYGRG